MEVSTPPITNEQVYSEPLIPDSTAIKAEMDAAALLANDNLDANGNVNPEIVVVGDRPAEKDDGCNIKAGTRNDKSRNPEGKEDIALQRIREIAGQLQAVNLCDDISDLADYAVDEIKELGKQIIKKKKRVSDKKLPPMKLPAPTPPSILGWIKKLVAGDALVQFEAYIRFIKQAIAYIQALTDIIKAVDNIQDQLQQCDIKGILTSKAKNELDKALKTLEDEIKKEVSDGVCTLMNGLGITAADIERVQADIKDVKDIVNTVKTATDELKTSVTSSYSSVKEGQANIDEGYGIVTLPFDIPASTAGPGDPYAAPEYSADHAAAFVETAEAVLEDIDTKVAEVIRNLVDQAQPGALQHDTLLVTDFGATGDGVTNDTAAFANAISRLIGGTVIVPYGEYVIDSLTIPEFITLAGDVTGPFDVEENILRYDANNVLILYGLSRANTTLYRAPTLSLSANSQLTLTGKHSNIQDLLFYYPGGDPTAASPTNTGSTIVVDGPESGHRISRCTFVNSYVGITINTGRTVVEDCLIGAFYRDIVIDTANNDVVLSRITSRPVWDTYFNLSYPQNIDTWVLNNSISLDVADVNELSVNRYNSEKRHTGIYFANSATGGGYGHLNDVSLDTVVYGVVANSTNASYHGYNFNNMTIVGTGRNPAIGSNSVATVVLNSSGNNYDPIITWDGGAVVGIFANNVYPVKNAGRCYVTNVRGINDPEAILLPVIGANTFPQTNAYYTNPFSIPVNIYFEASPTYWDVTVGNTSLYNLGERVYAANSTTTFVANGTISNINTSTSSLLIRMSTGTFPATNNSISYYANTYNIRSFITTANSYIVNSFSYTATPATVDKVLINTIPVQYNYNLKPNDTIRVDYTYDANTHNWKHPAWAWVGA